MPVWKNGSHPFALTHFRLRIHRAPAPAQPPLLHCLYFSRNILRHPRKPPCPFINSFVISCPPDYDSAGEFEFFSSFTFSGSGSFFRFFHYLYFTLFAYSRELEIKECREWFLE